MAALDFKALIRAEREKLMNESKKSSPVDKIVASCAVPTLTRTSGLPLQELVDTRKWELSLKGDFHKQTIGLISSVYYTPNAVSAEMEENLLDKIEQSGKQQAVWKQLKARRLQCWGNFPAPSSIGNVLDLSAPMPAWLEQMIDCLVAESVFTADMRPNNVLINQYNADEGILHHTDGPAYYDKVAIISLGSSCILSFRKNLSSDMIGKEFAGDVCSVVLAPRSMLIFEGEAYSEYMHGIEMEQPVQVVEEHGPCLNLHLTALPTNEQGQHIVRLFLCMLISALYSNVSYLHIHKLMYSGFANAAHFDNIPTSAIHHVAVLKVACLHRSVVGTTLL